MNEIDEAFEKEWAGFQSQLDAAQRFGMMKQFCAVIFSCGFNAGSKDMLNRVSDGLAAKPKETVGA